MNKKELKKIILTIILVIVISIIVFLTGQYIVNKNRKYTGSMVGTYACTEGCWLDNNSSYVILYENGYCRVYDTRGLFSWNSCTYTRTDDKINLYGHSIYSKHENNEVSAEYKITPEGNLEKVTTGHIYYRQ